MYNEVDPYCCDWLENLIAAGHVRPGRVERRSITELGAADCRDVQCHFFAGLGLWSYAARLAGWPDEAELWTGSCPCQPFSTAGRRLGAADPRHLWPEFARLIRECRPPIVVGEQVASPAGRAWLDAVYADLEAAGYTVGAADLPAAGVGAPHLRQRLYWVAYTQGERLERVRIHLRGRRPREGMPNSDRGSEAVGMGDADGEPIRRISGGSARAQAPEPRSPWGIGDVSGPSGWVECVDGKLRPVGAGVRVLVDGYPDGRVAQLRALGNAIVPQVAAAFLECVIGDLMT